MARQSGIGVAAAARMDAHPLSMATPAARKMPAPHHRPSLRLAMALAHVDPDGRRPLRPVGSMGAVGELQGQGMPAGRQGDLRLRLALAEVEVLVIGRHRLAERDRSTVDDKLMVAASRIYRVIAGRPKS